MNLLIALSHSQRTISLISDVFPTDRILLFDFFQPPVFRHRTNKVINHRTSFPFQVVRSLKSFKKMTNQTEKKNISTLITIYLSFDLATRNSETSITTNNTYFVFPVTVLAIVLKIFGGFMSSFKILLSVANGNPLSSISSKSFPYLLVHGYQHNIKPHTS